MRHGRKSKSKRFNGYKRHIATDLDSDLILAGAITPANRPEDEAAPKLKHDIGLQGRSIAELNIDRGYIASPLVDEILDAGGKVICKPWVARNGKSFAKGDFKLNLRDLTITCPAGETERIEFGSVVEFDPEACGHCHLRANCTAARSGSGRTVAIAENERLQHKLRKLQKTRTGRARHRGYRDKADNGWRKSRRTGRRGYSWADPRRTAHRARWSFGHRLRSQRLSPRWVFASMVPLPATDTSRSRCLLG